VVLGGELVLTPAAAMLPQPLPLLPPPLVLPLDTRRRPTSPTSGLVPWRRWTGMRT